MVQVRTSEKKFAVFLENDRILFCRSHLHHRPYRRTLPLSCYYLGTTEIILLLITKMASKRDRSNKESACTIDISKTNMSRFPPFNTPINARSRQNYSSLYWMEGNRAAAVKHWCMYICSNNIFLRVSSLRGRSSVNCLLYAATASSL